MIKQYNFDEFEAASKSDWMEKLTRDLGEDQAKRIDNWQIDRDLNLSAYYNQEHDFNHVIRNHPSSVGDWKYLQTFESGKAAIDKEILDALMNGADGLILNEGVIDQLNEMLAQVSPQYCTLGLLSNNPDSCRQFLTWYQSKDKGGLKGDVLLLDANTTFDEKRFLSRLDFLGSVLKQELPEEVSCININSAVIQEAGGSATLEIAFALSQLAAVVNGLQVYGATPNDLAKTTLLTTAVGSNYFLELAKIRVLRRLVGQVWKAYGVKDAEVKIHAKTSSWTKSALDSHTNFLRCTSEAMSAVLSGVNYLTIDPGQELHAADRIARNISNLLREESYLSKVADPASGSYYIEALTDQLASQSWKTFQTIEIQGGHQAALKSNFFRQRLLEDVQYRKERIETGKRKIVGVNDFGNATEQVVPAQLDRSVATLSEDFEALRKQVETYVSTHGESCRPTVYLLGVGAQPKMINARFTFITNFFSWAGLKVEPVSAQSQYKKEGVLLCCGADGDYKKDLIAQALPGNDAPSLIFAAGAPDPEASDQIKGWIHARTHRIEGVKNILAQMGVIENTPNHD